MSISPESDKDDLAMRAFLLGVQIALKISQQPHTRQNSCLNLLGRIARNEETLIDSPQETFPSGHLPVADTTRITNLAVNANRDLAQQIFRGLDNIIPNED